MEVVTKMNLRRWALLYVGLGLTGVVVLFAGAVLYGFWVDWQSSVGIIQPQGDAAFVFSNAVIWPVSIYLLHHRLFASKSPP